jgi:hypothetical protein
MMAFIMTFGLSSDGGWLVQAGLTLILLSMLVAGVILLLFAARDLMRDLRHYLGQRLPKNGPENANDQSSRAA